jgi:AraC-like DNA-binding protein
VRARRVGVVVLNHDGGELTLRCLRSVLATQLPDGCLDAFGYGLKTLARIRRMRRALALLSAGTPQAEAAFRAGYADQPHLGREIRALTGAPPSSFRPAG